MDTGKVMKGYLWYRVLDLGILKEMYEVGDFIDEASRVWLSDYFSYLEFIEKYRKEHPGEKLEIDEIEREIRAHGFLDLRAFDVKATADEAFAFLENSSLLKAAELTSSAARLQFKDNQ